MIPLTKNYAHLNHLRNQYLQLGIEDENLRRQ